MTTMTIWKVDVPIALPLASQHTVPVGAEPVACGITAATLPEHVSVWLTVNPAADPDGAVWLRVVGTGHSISSDEHYVGTVVDPLRPPLVWHVVRMDVR